MAANSGPTAGQTSAYSTLINNASAGDPYAPQISKLASDQFGATSNSGQVQDAYKALQGNLGGYANGSNLDFSTNPYIQQMLSTVGNSAANQVEQEFAGSGRDITGNAAGQKALGTGVTNAELPILSNLYTTEQGNQITAANDLNNAANTAATTAQGLDAGALATRQGGIATGNSAIAANNYAPNTILNLDQQLQSLPATDLAQYASLLLPAAGLGSQTTGTSNANTNTSSWGINLGGGTGGNILTAGLGALGL